MDTVKAELAAIHAASLCNQEPSVELALAAGVVDCAYYSNQRGMVAAYAGEGIVTMADGRKWRCIGHGTQGSGFHVSREGYIEFVPLN